MAIPANTAPWPLTEAAEKVKERVDQLLKQCTKAKAAIGTSYDVMQAIPRYIAGFNELITFVTVDCGYTSDKLGEALVDLYGSDLDWESDLQPSYEALKSALPNVASGIISRQAEIGSLLKVTTGSLSGDAGETVNAELSALMDSVLVNFET